MSNLFESNRFFSDKEKQRIKEDLQRKIRLHLDLETIYDSERCFLLSKEICQLIKNKMKSLKIPSYKFVVQVVLGEKSRSENLTLTSKCLWDVENDHFWSLHYSNSILFFAATIFSLNYSWQRISVDDKHSNISSREKQKFHLDSICFFISDKISSHQTLHVNI